MKSVPMPRKAQDEIDARATIKAEMPTTKAVCGDPAFAEPCKNESQEQCGDCIAFIPEGTALAVISQTEPAAPIADNGKTLKLGEINARLGFTVSADFLASLGFIAKTDKNAKLYRECDFRAICDALVRHIQQVAGA